MRRSEPEKLSKVWVSKQELPCPGVRAIQSPCVWMVSKNWLPISSPPSRKLHTQSLTHTFTLPQATLEAVFFFTVFITLYNNCAWYIGSLISQKTEWNHWIKSGTDTKESDLYFSHDLCHCTPGVGLDRINPAELLQNCFFSCIFLHSFLYYRLFGVHVCSWMCMA